MRLCSMTRLSHVAAALVAKMSGENDIAAAALRRAVVHDLWQRAVRDVFQEGASLVLAHTNAVYIMSGKKGSLLRRFDRPTAQVQRVVEGKVLVIYSDDSMVRSELDNRQELLKMKFAERGEQIEMMKIMPSVRDMKHRHPFEKDVREDKGTPRERIAAASGGKKPPRDQQGDIFPNEDDESVANAVENDEVRASLKRAMEAMRKNNGFR